VLFSTPDWTGIVTGRFSVAVCRTCGLARTDPQPTPETLALAYGKDYGPHDATVKTTEAPRGLLRWCLANYRGYPLGRPAPALLRALLKPLAAMKFRNRYWVGHVPYVGDGRLLDLGCGIGRYVARMAVAGWKAEGLEPAPRAVQAGRTAGLEVERMTSLRRPTFVRRSMALMAKDKDSAVCHLLARGRLVPRLLSHVASVVGRTDEMVCMARRS